MHNNVNIGDLVVTTKDIFDINGDKEITGEVVAIKEDSICEVLCDNGDRHYIRDRFLNVLGKKLEKVRK